MINSTNPVPPPLNASPPTVETGNFRTASGNQTIQTRSSSPSQSSDSRYPVYKNSLNNEAPTSGYSGQEDSGRTYVKFDDDKESYKSTGPVSYVTDDKQTDGS